MEKRSVLKNYRFLAIMLGSMVAGCLFGWFFPERYWLIEAFEMPVLLDSSDWLI